jgi:hypothetical protein
MALPVTTREFWLTSSESTAEKFELFNGGVGALFCSSAPLMASEEQLPDC